MGIALFTQSFWYFSLMAILFFIIWGGVLYWLARRPSPDQSLFYLVLALPQVLAILWLSFLLLGGILASASASIIALLLITLVVIIIEIYYRGQALLDTAGDGQKVSFAFILVFAPFIGWVLYRIFTN